jgi:hypothetical protein
MSFLSQKNAEFLSARLTQKGRKSIAQGNFQIKFFQVGDSEFDYTSPFNNLDGVQNNPQQNVLAPFDKDSQVKYPYKLDSSDVTTTYGVPMMDSMTETIRNGMGPAGFITEYKEYDSTECSGTTVECTSIRLPLSVFTGGNTITFTEILSYGNCSGVTQQDIDILNIHSFNDVEFITVVFDNQFINEDQVVSGNSMSLIYKIVKVETVTGVTTTPTCDEIITGSTTLTIDRNTPNLSSFSGYAQIIRNECKIENPIGSETATVCVSNQVDPSDQHDPWTLNVVWQEKPIGSDVDGFDENITGFTSSKHISTMEYLGYGISDGQVTNTGTTYNNSYSEEIIVKPEEQKCIAIIHYSELGHIYDDPDRFFKYDDYIGSSTTEGVLVDGETVTDVEFFNVYIPFIYYENSTGTTIGAEFKMDITDQFIDSTVAGTPGDIRTKYIKYRYLLDEVGNKVGKVFVDKKIIVFDDQELVALLDYRSNRRHTLPAPKVYHIPSDTTAATSCFSGTTGQTFWVTYMFEYTSDEQLNSLPCNYFSKVGINVVDGECEITYPSNIAVKFGGGSDHPNGVGSFQHLKDDFNDVTQGYVADRLWVLIQETTDQTDLLPDPNLWLKIDITSRIPNHNVGDLINPTELRDHSFVITGGDLNSAILFDLETYLKNNPTDTNYLGDFLTTTEPQFGDEQPFPGSVKLVRCTDIEEMRFLVNLPNTQFTTTQNPTHPGDSTTKVVTEVVLLDQNKDVLVSAKTSSPIKRLGTQVFAVKIDF